MKTRNFILSMIVLCSMTIAQAQRTDVMTATLQHGDNVTVFTTQTAFANAYAAAVDGDVITLSPGQFTATNLTKSVNIYGSGFEEDEINGTGITQINGNLTIGVTDETLSNIHIEGVYFYDYFINNASSPLTNVTIKKCSFRRDISIRSEITNVTFCDCYTCTIYGLSNIMANNLLVTNCYVNGCVKAFQSGSTVLIDHCIINGFIAAYENGNIPNDLVYSAFTWKNCVFTWWGSTSYWSNWQYNRVGLGATVYNCIYRDSMGNISFTSYDLIQVERGTQIFSDANNDTYTPTRTFTLIQPTVWLGTDGTQIGVSGGNYPWSRVPATPVVKSLDLNVSGTNLNVTFDAETR